jgi:putative ABC transport system permease protein
VAARTKKTESSSGRGRALASSLALRDLWHDRRTTLALVFTVAAILAPLLLLFGLKTGVVSAMRNSLLNDPRNLEIVVYGNTRLDRDWFRTYADRPDVAFIVPRTRTINATLDLVKEDRRILSAVQVIPTAPGDPLLPDALPVPSEPGEVLVTATLAAKLGVESRQPVLGVVKRTDRGRDESAELDLRVIGIVPESSFAKDALFATPDLLAAAEDYRDGLRDALGSDDLVRGIADQRPHFANARLYASGLDAVASLAQAMREDGIEIRTQAEAIESVRSVDRVLSFVFYVIALVAGIGCALALGGALWVNVERKHRELALLRLFGFDDQAVILLPAVQSLAISTAGFVLAALAYQAGASAFNRVLGTHLAGQGYVCHMGAGSMLAAAGATLVIALFAAAAAGVPANRVDAAESLRENR